MLLDQVHKELGWPAWSEVYKPTGEGARVFAELASQKLGRAIERFPSVNSVQVGVLTADPETTTFPFALVCTFANPVEDTILFAAQKLAWNFSRSLLLITIEPHVIRKWSCYEPPFDTEFGSQRSNPEILPRINIDTQTGQLERDAAQSLAWVELLSGRFFAEHQHRFLQEKRADSLLLSNLRDVRLLLRAKGLDFPYIHDLLARIIFIQFLFDRRDSLGRAALDEQKLYQLFKEGVLSTAYSTFPDVLSRYDDAYRLFKWLNDKFNGDLFPGKATSETEQEFEWREEMEHVRLEHLQLLADFVRGDVVMNTGQKCLWPQYAFDAIPLEFISSIYEEFVSGEDGVGIHYTPSHLVDLMLDRVLPWGNDNWNVKILDPACGSGIFLVKAYQRLIYRWKYAHRNAESNISAQQLRSILEHNLFGVDIDPSAVRVASFSLYLAMCDEIDPRYYWSNPSIVHFPRLRDNRIICSDFFSEDHAGFQTPEDQGEYDLVIGNPPWGDTSISEEAKAWALANDWKVANKDFGVLFLIKATSLTRPAGQICMIQSAGPLLYNLSKTASRLRHRIFTQFKKVEGVISLSAYRLFLFTNVIGPSCIVRIRNVEPDGTALLYECPKPLHTGEDWGRLVIEEQDIHWVYPQEILDEPWLWSTLMWGSNRDRSLIRRLQRETTLEKLSEGGQVKTREGINFGNRQRWVEELVGRLYVEPKNFLQSGMLLLSTNGLKPITDPRIHSRDSSNFGAFQLPQLLIKVTWSTNASRFQAKMVASNPDAEGVICSQSFITVHTDKERQHILETACATYNSSFAVYYLLLTSGRFAFYRPEPLVKELRRLPLPKATKNILDGIAEFDELDSRVSYLLGLQEAELILVDDLNRFTLPDYKGKLDSPGRQPTRRTYDNGHPEEPELMQYCNVFREVLRTAYGREKYIGAMIFSEQSDDRDSFLNLPVRLIQVHLNNPDLNSIRVEPMHETELRDRLLQLYQTMHDSFDKPRYYQRTVRTYDSVATSAGTGIVLNIIKPDQVRYWTRSMALRDADRVVADLTGWAQASSQAGQYAVIA